MAIRPHSTCYACRHLKDYDIRHLIHNLKIANTNKNIGTSAPLATFNVTVKRDLAG